MAGKVLDTERVAALLESSFSKIADHGRLKDLSDYGLAGYELLDAGSFSDNNFKAITIKAPDGSIFVHFNGTGTGNWGYNAAAYGAEPQPSKMQIWALDYFDSMVEKHYTNSGGGLYATGHSQGGNNAQFVTIRSQYGDYITRCIALDAPGFSYQFVEESKTAANYESQCNKIWAYNGEHDFVSCLGQVSIIRDGHTIFVAYTDPNGNPYDVAYYHHVDGMLESGKFVFTDANGNPITQSEFREFILLFNESIKNLPPDQQVIIAELIMKLVDPAYKLTEADLELMKKILVPALVEFLANNPESIAMALSIFGVDGFLSEALTEAIKDFNNLSPEDRQRVIEALANGLVIVDGEVTFELSELINADSAHAILDLIPILENLVGTVTEEALRELGVPEWAIFIIIKYVDFKIDQICVLLRIIAVGYLIFDGIKKAWDNFWNKAGREYAANNPYFKVDTAKLRDYATRINNVNSRLSRLDSSLRRCFWEVPAYEMWRFAWISFLTSGSPTLNQVKSYLNDTAGRLETAERKARGNVGG